MDRRTLETMLVDVPTTDSRYSLADFADALTHRSAIAAQRLAKLTAEAALAKSQVQEREGRLVDRFAFIQPYARVCVEIVRIIEDSKLADGEKDAIKAAIQQTLRLQATALRAEAATLGT